MKYTRVIFVAAVLIAVASSQNDCKKNPMRGEWNKLKPDDGT